MPMKFPSGLGRTLPMGKSSIVVKISTVPLKNLREYRFVVINRLPDQPIRKWAYAELCKKSSPRRANLIAFLNQLHQVIFEKN